MVFYRKYRPQNFEELIGQDHVKKTLLTAFQSGKLAHAYLFTGPRGSGKTSTARILAKIVNCVAEEGTIPCNNCDSCISITDGSNLDLIEIDAASNRGIDDIRDLRDKIKLTPSSLKKKVYIIDEVHMLTTEAFNALLKTLEEPPSHVIFILATTEVHKLPQTILSRVQRFDFKLATINEIKLALKNICDKEKIKLTDEVLGLIAEVAEGSFRDAVKFLDQVASMGEVDIKEVRAVLRANDFSENLSLLEYVISKDSKAALNLVGQLVDKGVNIKESIGSVLKILRQILLIKNQVLESVKEEAGTGRFEKIKDLAQKVDLAKVILFIENFQKGLEQLKFTTIPSLPLEVAVIKSVNQELRIMNQGEAQITQAVIQSKQSEQKSLDLAKVVTPSMGINNDEGLKTDPIPSVETMQSTDDVVTITDKWTYILETIKPYNFSLEALLRQTKVKNCDGVNVILEVPYSFHQRILEAPKSRTLLESILADILGKSVRVTTVIGKREVAASELANVEVAQDDEIVRLAAEIFNS